MHVVRRRKGGQHSGNLEAGSATTSGEWALGFLPTDKGQDQDQQYSCSVNPHTTDKLYS